MMIIESYMSLTLYQLHSLVLVHLNNKPIKFLHLLEP